MPQIRRPSDQSSKPAAPERRPSSPAAVPTPQPAARDAVAVGLKPIKRPEASPEDVARLLTTRKNDGFGNAVVDKRRAQAVTTGGGDASVRTLSVAEIRKLEKAAGRALTIDDLARRFPTAQLGGRGATLEQIARTRVDATRTLGTATVDAMGDLDVTALYGAELRANNMDLVLREGDEFPVPLAFTVRNGTMVVRDPAQRRALEAAGFKRNDKGEVRVDFRKTAEVEKALGAFKLDPKDSGAIQRVLDAQGVRVPLAAEDKLRRVLLAKLDHPRNELDIDDRLVKNPGGHNHLFRPTVYASARVSPEHLDDVILKYKRINNQSYAGQGNWVTRVIGKDEKSQHEFDAEITWVKLDRGSRERETILAARHYFGELYTKDRIKRVEQTTGERLALSVAYKAHGTRLAERERATVWAGHGKNGVTALDPRDRVLKDEHMGFEDVKGGRARLLTRDQFDLVLDSDDQQTLNLKLQFGETRKGLMGTKILDAFNDGTQVDYYGTSWYYEQEKINVEKLKKA